ACARGTTSTTDAACRPRRHASSRPRCGRAIRPCASGAASPMPGCASPSARAATARCGAWPPPLACPPCAWCGWRSATGRWTGFPRASGGHWQPRRVAHERTEPAPDSCPGSGLLTWSAGPPRWPSGSDRDLHGHMPTAKTIAGRVLVVDDQPSNLRIISALLSRQGYTVHTAESGEEALQALGKQSADLLLLDMMMPGMDGFELLEEVRRHPDWSSLPVVFLTAAHDRDLLLRAFDSGAVDYVTKPFMPEELLARVQAHIGLKLTRDRLERVARERQELVNLVAHDLKNPLSSIFFASDLLITGQTREDRIPRYLQMIRDSA